MIKSSDDGPEEVIVNAEEIEEVSEVVVAGEEIIEEIVEEVVDVEELHREIDVEEGEEIVYVREDGSLVEFTDVADNQNMLYQMYQPESTEHGTFKCKICERAGKDTEYPDRATFVAHRYKCHGSFNNNVQCPMANCREVYASLFTLRRHLTHQHGCPLEIHQQSFENIGEFEKYRHLIEITSGCQYMMHTKQPKYRRQVMHCAKSEHKLVLQTQKHRLPKERMLKERAACPSVISYRVEPSSGQVHAFMQLFHVGHNPDGDSLVTGSAIRPMDIVFPVKPACFAERPMQYVQIDVHDMQTRAVYGNKIYESVLVVTCIKSKFMWCRPLSECTRTNIGRILNSIFNEFGLPEGFSTAYSPTYIRDTLKSLESVYAVEIREIWNEPPPYAALENWVYEMSEQELGTRNRWVEQMQFVVMEYNQKPLAEFEDTPFERMFNRKPPNLYSNGDGDDNEVAFKCRRFHQDLRKEDLDVEPVVGTAFGIGDKVFLRKGITKPRRGNNTQYYFGWISDVDPNAKLYPYKVHFSSTDSPWPCERNMYAWVSVYDLLPTSHKIREMDELERQEAIRDILCHCSGTVSREKYDLTAVGENALKSSKCVLFKNILCTNDMSRHCCKEEGQLECKFHDMYPTNDESYAKMESTLTSFLRVAKVESLKEKVIRERHSSEDLIDVEHPEEPSTSSRLQNMHNPEEIKVTEHIDVEELVEYQYPPPIPTSSVVPMKRPRKPKNEEGEQPKRRKREEEDTSSDATRRASGRRTARPKNLDDYVE